MSEQGHTARPTAAGDDYEDLFENAPCGYLTMTPDGRIVRANALMASWTGHPVEQLVGRRLHDLLTVGTRILYETSFAPQLSMLGVCEELSLDLRTADGNVVAVLASGRVRTDASGQPLLTRMVFFKASERRRYERQLVDAQARSQDQERAMQALLESERDTARLREEFIAVVGHDLRNPIAAVSAGLSMLARGASEERAAFLIPEMQRALSRANQILTNLMDFARGRLGAGLEILAPHPVSLEAVFRDVVSEVAQVAAQPIELVMDLPRPIRADPQRLGQLLSNLVGNAVMHGAAGTPVRVEATDQGGILRLAVTNQGPPIPEDVLSSLFLPFSRGGDPASLQGLGLGLGLYIASEIARAHGGRIDVVSSETDGTTFALTMPARHE